jgi:acyl carrier protein
VDQERRVTDEKVLAVSSPQRTEQCITTWLREYLVNLLGLQEHDIDDHAAFARYGLDSSAAVAMAADLGDWIGCDLDPSSAYDHPSIAELSRALGQSSAVRKALSNRPGRQAVASEGCS